MTIHEPHQTGSPWYLRGNEDSREVAEVAHACSLQVCAQCMRNELVHMQRNSEASHTGRWYDRSAHSRIDLRAVL